MKCLYCQKEIKLKRKTKKFCDDNCRQGYFRKGLSVTEVVPVSVTKDNSVTENVTVKDRSVEKELQFSKGQSIKERIEIYKSLYTDSTFVPNWIVHGFESKEEAIRKALNSVEESTGVANSGLQIE